MAKLILAALVIVAIWKFLRPTAKRTPDESEAAAILGVARDADAETIRAAHRRLLMALHPDQGGSTELTRRINAARDVLLKRS